MSGITITVDHKKRIQIEIGCGAIHLPLEEATALRDNLNAAIYEAKGFEVPPPVEPVEPGSYKMARGIMKGHDETASINDDD